MQKVFGLGVLLALSLGTVGAESGPLFGAQGDTPGKNEALGRLRAGASQGMAEALNQLGQAYQSGNGLAVDYVKAYALFHLASSLPGAGGGQVAAANRDSVALQMSAGQVMQAQELFSRCYGDDVGNCAQRIISGGQATVATLNSTRDKGRLVVPLENFQGIYMVPAIVNGVMNLKFAVDSGASNVTIPADVVASLVKAGSITNVDFLGQGIYSLADGSKAQSRIIRLRSVKVGDVLIEDVRANETPENSPLLLGQSFLRKLKSWSMDNGRHALVLE